MTFPINDLTLQEILKHHAYSPDLGPSNYHLLPALKGYRFKSDDYMETAAIQ
jgi:hypothetical protein